MMTYLELADRIVAIALTDSSRVGEARRYALALGPDDESYRGRLALVVSEAATNVLKHAQRGELVVRAIEHDGTRGVEVLAIDAGPGMADVERAMGDGYSTAGTHGSGLGAMRRMADELEVYSQPGKGTVVLARVWEKPLGTSRGPVAIGVVRVPKAGEQVCGDDWSVTATGPRRVQITVADGLGHGPSAAEASHTAARVGAEQAALGRRASETLGALHAALRATRGAAVAVADLDADARTVRFAGLGNIAGGVYTLAGSRNFVSHNGTVGHEARKIQEFDYDWPAGAMAIFHSDGLSARWELERHPGLLARDPSIVAAVLYREYTRHRDDAIVVVARAVDR